MKLTSAAELLKWDEDRTLTATPRVTPAVVSMALPEIKAKLTTHYIMTYTRDGNAAFQFTHHVDAEDFGGRKGSFVVQGTGTFTKATYNVEGKFRSVEGAATGEIEALGEIVGSFASQPTPENPGAVGFVFEHA